MKQKGEKELKIHNGHAEVVIRLFDLKQLHKKWSSLFRLAEALNDEGYQTTQGKAFTKLQVKWTNCGISTIPR
jgi:site-specific DNA recombinase